MFQRLASTLRPLFQFTMPYTRRHIMSATLSATLANLANLAAAATHKPQRRMPSIFVGHGSPMNALASNTFTRMLEKWGNDIGRPTAILVVSAHWLTQSETKVSVIAQPKTIHDFGGFPQALFDMQYPAPGAPALAMEAARLLAAQGAKPADDWGLDHGAWTVLHFLYPQADIPVFQVSIDYAQGGDHHLAVGRELSALRDQGVLILASGNVVHNLRHLDMGAADGLTASRPWAQSFDTAVKSALLSHDTKALANYARLDAGAQLAAQTPDHYWPLLYAMGAARDGEAPQFVFEGFQLGTLSMRCVQWG
jgi:4,5-DOPA dioxygenase extradiol